MKRDLVNRTKLEEAIPIQTPLVVHVDTNNVCNFRCKFCTTGDHALLAKYERPKGFMTFELFRKIIDDLTQFESKVKDLIFHKNGEPLLHPDIVQMIRYAKEKNVAKRTILVTNASNLTPRLARGIADSGIDYIQISMQAVSDEGYKEVSQVNVSYDKLVFAVGYLYAHKKESTHLNVKIMDIGLSEEEKQKFNEDFKNICNTVGIEHPISYTQPNIKDTSLGLKRETTHDAYSASYKEICTLPFYTMNINFNGKVSACSFDWRHKQIMGEVDKTPLKEIWFDERYNNFRKLQLQKKRNENEFCNGCEAVYNLLDNIDMYGEELLKRFK
jgi:radical SAM protein with 4Fe4S-binding SPASM domain